MNKCCPCPSEPKETVLLPITGLRLPGLGSALEVDASALKNCGCDNSLPANLAEPYDLFVSPDGSDQNDGKTSETPLATIQAALNLSNRFVRREKIVSLFLASGIYHEEPICDFTYHYPRIWLAGTSPDDCTISGRIRIQNSGRFYVRDLTCLLPEKSENRQALDAHYGAWLSVADCHVVTEQSQGFIVGINCYQSTLSLTGRVHIKGGAGSAIVAALPTYAHINANLSLDVSGDVFWTTLGGNIEIMPGALLSGSCKGRQYSLRAGGIHKRNPAGNVIPGTAGFIGKGGYFEQA